MKTSYSSNKNYTKIDNLKKIDLAYIAGLIDCDGYISLGLRKKKKSHPEPRLCIVSNTNKELVEWVGTLFNHSIIETREYRNPKWKNSHMVFIQQRLLIKEVLHAVLPYLIVKKKHAQIMINFIDYRISKKRKDPVDEYEIECWRNLKALNQKGKWASDYTVSPSIASKA